MKSIQRMLPVGLFLFCGLAGSSMAQSAADIAEMKKKLFEVQQTKEQEKAELSNFDDLDFNVYSNRRWDLFEKSHSKDVIVHYPDGSTTKGLDAHIAALKPQFVFAPDSKIIDHPIRIASGAWTAVMGTMSGTFSQPMPTANGKTIAPTGKQFKLNMVTVAHWENNQMVEEWLFWDNNAFMKQIGVAP